MFRESNRQIIPELFERLSGTGPMKSKPKPQPRRRPGATASHKSADPAEQQITDSNADYRLLVENVHYGIIVLGGERRILMANRTAAAMLASDGRGLTGKDFLEFVHPDGWKSCTELFAADKRDELHPEVHELQLMPCSGGSLPVDVHSDPVVWQGREAVLVTMWDVAERKRNEQALRDSESTLRALVDLIPYPVYAKDADGRFLLVNPATARAAGCTVDALVGRKYSEFISNAEDVERIRQDDLEVINTGRPKFIAEEPVRDAQGVTHIVQTSKVPISFPGLAQPAVLGVVVDITEHKEVERQLREREETFRALAETAGEGIVVVDAHRRVLYSNPKAQSMLGVSAEDLSHKDMLDFVVNEEKDDGVIRHRELFRGGRLPQRGVQTVIDSLGQSLKVEIISAKTMWYGQEGLLIMFHDVTDRLRMEEELCHHQENLERKLAERTEYIRRIEHRQADFEKLAAVSGLAGRMAHEINNPLGGVKNAFLLIKSEIREDAPCAKYVRMVDKEVDRMTRIVRELYNLYRPGLRPTAAFRVTETIADVTTLLEAECQSSNVHVQTNVQPPDATFFGNEDTVRQVLFNLLKNALEASAPGSVVAVDAVVAEGALHLSVADQGTGIPDDVRGQIFEPFFTTKLSRGSVGLGLGLPVSKNLVEAVGGRLDFETVVGKGTVFRVHLPSAGRSGP